MVIARFCNCVEAIENRFESTRGDRSRRLKEKEKEKVIKEYRSREINAIRERSMRKDYFTCSVENDERNRWTN